MFNDEVEMLWFVVSECETNVNSSMDFLQCTKKNHEFHFPQYSFKHIGSKCKQHLRRRFRGRGVGGDLLKNET